MTAERVTLDDFNSVPNTAVVFQSARGSERGTASARTPHPPLEVAWPDSPDEEAFIGIAGDVVRTIEPHSESDPVALLVQALAAFGSVIGRRAHQRVEATRHYGNLYVALVGRTGKARKGSSWDHNRRLFESVDESWATACNVSGLTSGEGLIWAVRDSMEGGEEGVADKRLLAVETELSGTLQVLNRQGNSLSACIRQAWDSGALRTLTKNSPARVTGAHVSIIGHTTAEELRRYLRETEMANGFGNRFLWACVRRSKMLPDGGHMERVDVASLVRRLTDAVDFAKEVDEVRRDDEARELWHDVYPRLSAERPGLLGAMTSRAEAQVVRLSLLYALLDCSQTIRVEHLRAALALWGYCERSAAYTFGTALGDEVADTIARALRASRDGLTRTEIRDLFGRNKKGGEIDRALGVLLEHGLVWNEHVETQGRPAEVWQAVTTKTTDTTEVGASVVNVVSVVHDDAEREDDDDPPAGTFGELFGEVPSS
jgi:hypothetical protein